jgi:hypothetical protein
MAEIQLQANCNAPPTDAKDAVFLNSDPVPEGAVPVSGIDFNRARDGDISVVDLVEGMSNMGFQASAIGEAVQIINGMVRDHLLLSGQLLRILLSDWPYRGRGRTMKLEMEQLSFLATHRI